MTDAHRPFAVVTGGSNGIGLELARQFIENGYDVMIAAENPDHLSEAARTLAGTPKIETHAGDLSREDGVDGLYAAIKQAGRPVDVLCVNAGVGLGGPFADTDLQKELKMIDLNVRGSVQLTKLVLKDMVARDQGKLLFTSSIAATMPDPFEAGLVRHRAGPGRVAGAPHARAGDRARRARTAAADVRPPRDRGGDVGADRRRPSDGAVGAGGGGRAGRGGVGRRAHADQPAPRPHPDRYACGRAGRDPGCPVRAQAHRLASKGRSSP